MSEYEFSESENLIFRNFNRNTVIFAIVIILASSTIMLQYFLDSDPNILDLVSGISFLILAIVLFLSVNNFYKIITTQGQDITELMKGLKEIARGWLLVNLIFFMNRLLLMLVVFNVLP